MVVVPTDKAVTTPVLLIDATEVLELTQGLEEDAVPVPVSAEVPGIQDDSVPEMLGNAFTVKRTVILQPLELV